MADPREEVADILNRKLKAYDEFLCATGLLARALECGDLTAAENSILRREELIGVIGAMDRRIEHYRKRGLFDRNIPLPGNWKGLSEAIRERLERIVSANCDCHAVAASTVDATRKNLIRLRQTKGGLRGYAPPKAQPIPKFLNVRT